LLGLRQFFNRCFLLILYVGLASSVSIKCVYKQIDFKGEKFYSCTFGPFKYTTKENIDNVAGLLSTDKKKSDVKGISFLNSNYAFFPTGFEKHFVNIEFISSANAGVKTLTRYDLKAFVKLRVIDFSGNKIETLERSIFLDNLNLEKVFFTKNLINTVGWNILKSLQKLKVVDFGQNSCVSSKADNVKAINDLSNELNLKCVDYDALITEKFSPFEKKLNESEARNSALSLEVESLKTELEREKTKLGGVEVKNIEFKSAIDSKIAKLQRDSSAEVDEKLSEIQSQLDELRENQRTNDTEENLQLTEMLDDLKAQIDKQCSTFVGRIDEVWMKIDNQTSDFNETLANLKETIDILKEAEKATSADLNHLSATLNNSVEAQQLTSSEGLSSNQQFYLLILLCSLFTITMTILLLVTISSRCKRHYIINEYKMRGYSESE
jgi:hypothetical protein